MSRNSESELAKAKKERNTYRAKYTCAWLWFLVVSVSWVGVYMHLLDLTDIVLSEFPILAQARQEVTGSWIATSLGIVAGLLLWWRITKVLVLHGAPISWWMTFAQGTKEKGINRRAATIVFIGDSFNLTSEPGDGYLLYVAIFRPHPRSDKLIRSRLEYLIVTLPFGLALVITESRFAFTRAQPAIKRTWAYRAGRQYWE